MHRFRVKTDKDAYPVVVGSGAWKELRRLVSRGYSSTFILTEKRIWERWRDDFIHESGLEAARVVFVPSGEKSKSLSQAERVAGNLLKHGADRRSLLVLFGGGVIGDLGGFVASTYMRGIDCVQVPTTVVGQVDSAVGGKTAVNVGAMKNLVGTFYPPRMVLADPRVLGSLGRRTFRSGLYEVAKHSILDGIEFFERLAADLGSFLPENAPKLGGAIAQAVKVKVDVVNRDEREQSLRQVLNLGHTFGHALEAATGYRRFLHGEAVGWGLLAITLLAERLGYLRSLNTSVGKRHDGGSPGASDAERIRRLIWRIGALPRISDVSPQLIARLLPHDKKAVAGAIHWVIPERIGKVRIVTGIPLAEAEATWRELQRRGQKDERES
jgi:3-dehydroquinate synthase